MKRILLLCFGLIVLLCSCADGGTETVSGSPVNSQEDSASSGAPESSGPVSGPAVSPGDTRMEIMLYETDGMTASQQLYVPRAFTGDSIICTKIDGENFALYAHDVQSSQKRLLGSSDAFSFLLNPLSVVRLGGEYYFSIDTGGAFEGAVSNLMRFDETENSLTLCQSQALRSQWVFTQKYGEQIAQMTRKTVDGVEKTCIELYDPQTNETSLFLSRDVELEDGTTDVAANFAIYGEDLYLFIQKYTPVYDEQAQVVDMEWTAWTVEQYDREKKLVAEFSCEEAKSYFTSNVIAQFYVWRDYLYFASWGEGALFKIEGQSLHLAAKTVFLSDFFPALDLDRETPEQILFSSYSHRFFLFEPKNQRIRVIDYPLKESEKIVSSFVSGETVCFEVWDTQENAYGRTVYHCYLSVRRGGAAGLRSPMS